MAHVLASSAESKALSSFDPVLPVLSNKPETCSSYCDSYANSWAALWHRWVTWFTFTPSWAFLFHLPWLEGIIFRWQNLDTKKKKRDRLALVTWK